MRWAFAGVAVAVVGAACSKFDAGVSPAIAADDGGAESPHTADSGEAIGQDGGGPAPPVDAVAPVDAGPCPIDMVWTGAFCIDRTEVTEAAYRALPIDFVQADALCAFKKFPPVPHTGSALGDAFPVTGIDWCDAREHCMRRGKRLCTTSEWSKACGGPSARKFPYGSTLDLAACNGQEAGEMVVVPVGTFPRCEGGYPGLFDMSGNIDEWTDECNGAAGAEDICFTRGGEYTDGTAQSLECAARVDRRRDTATAWIGFRCCK